MASADEIDWLSKYALELAAIRPEQVLKRLFKAMSRQYDAEESTDPAVSDGDIVGTDDSGVYVEHGAFSRDADAADGGADSFG